MVSLCCILLYVHVSVSQPHCRERDEYECKLNSYFLAPDDNVICFNCTFGWNLHMIYTVFHAVLDAYHVSHLLFTIRSFLKFIYILFIVIWRWLIVFSMFKVWLLRIICTHCICCTVMDDKNFWNKSASHPWKCVVAYFHSVRETYPDCRVCLVFGKAVLVLFSENSKLQKK